MVNLNLVHAAAKRVFGSVRRWYNGSRARLAETARRHIAPGRFRAQGFPAREKGANRE